MYKGSLPKRGLWGSAKRLTALASAPRALGPRPDRFLPNPKRRFRRRSGRSPNHPRLSSACRSHLVEGRHPARDELPH